MVEVLSESLRGHRRRPVSRDREDVRPQAHLRPARPPRGSARQRCTPTPRSRRSSASAREYELTGDPRYRDIATNLLGPVVHHRSYVIGGNSDGESFFPVGRRRTTSAPKRPETCNTYNMLKLTRHLFAWDADGRIDGLLRAGAVQPHPRLAGPEDGPGHLLLPAEAGRVQDLLDADRFLLVLRRHRHGEPRQVQRHDLLPRRGVALREPVHPVGAVVEGQGAHGAAGDEVSRTGLDVADDHRGQAGASLAQGAISRVGDEWNDAHGERPSAVRDGGAGLLRRDRSASGKPATPWRRGCR